MVAESGKWLKEEHPGLDPAQIKKLSPEVTQFLMEETEGLKVEKKSKVELAEGIRKMILEGRHRFGWGHKSEAPVAVAEFFMGAVMALAADLEEELTKAGAVSEAMSAAVVLLHGAKDERDVRLGVSTCRETIESLEKRGVFRALKDFMLCHVHVEAIMANACDADGARVRPGVSLNYYRRVVPILGVNNSVRGLAEDLENLLGSSNKKVRRYRKEIDGILDLLDWV